MTTRLRTLVSYQITPIHITEAPLIKRGAERKML